MSPRRLAASLSVAVFMATAFLPSGALAAAATPTRTQAVTTAAGSFATSTVMAVGRRVDLSRLPRLGSIGAAVTRRSPGFHTWRATGSAAPSGATSTAPALTAPRIGQSSATARPSVVSPPQLQLGGVSFAGLADPSGCTGLCVEPPDPWVAVNSGTILQATNAGVTLTVRPNSFVHTFPLREFFLEPAGETVDGDARVVWDGLHQRWIGTELSLNNSGIGSLYLAISSTPNAGGPWLSYRLPMDHVLPDYPGLGLSGDKVVLSANDFAISGGTIGSYLGAQLFAVDVATLLANPASITFTSYTPDTSLFTWRPAVNLTPASELDLVVGTANGANLDVGFARLTGTQAAKNLALSAVQDLTTGPTALPPFTDPTQPYQFRTASQNPIDGRPTDALWQSNSLWFVSTTECTPAGDTAARNCAHVTGIDTDRTLAAPTVVSDILQGTAGQDTFWGGIGLTLHGGLVVAWSQASATTASAISTYASYRTGSDPPGTLRTPILVQAGAGTYTGTRWGDYVGVAQDPVDPQAVWLANEYSTAGGDWATQVVNLRQAEAPTGDTYVPLTPTRILDTRSGLGLPGALLSHVGQTFQVTGVGGVPANAVAVTGNLTVTQQSARGFLYLGPNLTNSPTSSTLNFPVGDDRANGVTVGLSGSGTLSVTYAANSTTATTQVVFDVTGYFVADATAASYVPLNPARILDTRSGIGLSGTLTSHVARTFQVTGAGGVPAYAVAVTGNLTATQQKALGFLYLGPNATNAPTSSTLNFPVGDNRANNVTVALSPTGTLSVTYAANSSTATTQAIFDVTGYFVPDAQGAWYVPITPTRVLDSRIAVGFSGPLATHVAQSFQSGATPHAIAQTGNLTVTAQTALGYLFLGPLQMNFPTTSTLNFPVGDDRANGVTGLIGPGGSLSVTYASDGVGSTAQAIYDLTGYFVPPDSP